MNAPLRESSDPIQASELILRDDGSLYHLGIRPESVADKIIIVGDPDRVSIISSMFDRVDFRVENREFVVHTGEIFGKRITVVSSGIGVDNIDIVINELDAAVNVDLQTRRIKDKITTLQIVRIGTSGSLHDDIPLGAFVSSVYAFAIDGVPYSYSATLNQEEKRLLDALQKKFDWQASNPNLYTVKASDELLKRIAFDTVAGITATANGFYGPQGRSVRLQSNMEKRIDRYADFRFDGLKITNFEMECSGIYSLASMLGHHALTLCTIIANRSAKEFHNNPSTSVESLVRLVLERF